jgi:hypothetical protein
MHVPAHHGPSKPRGRFSTAVKVPRRSRRTSWEVLRSLHRGVQLVLRFRHLLPVRSTGSPAHVSALAGTSTRLVIRPVIRGPSGRIFPVSRPSLSCCLSAAGIRLLGTLSRQRGSAPLTIGLPPRLRVPAPARRTLARFTRSARMRPRPGRAGRLLYPGDSGAHRPSMNPRPSPAASQRPVPGIPVQQPSPGCGGNEASAKVSW